MSVCRIAAVASVLLCLARPDASADEDTLPRLKDGRVPQTLDEIWAGFDPRDEPLETETLEGWEVDGIVCRIVRFRIGVFKGKKAVMVSQLPGGDAWQTISLQCADFSIHAVRFSITQTVSITLVT